MSDLIDATLARLKDTSIGSPPWLGVYEIDALSQINDGKPSSNRMPCLYVFLVSDSPKSDVRGSGAYLQSCVATVGIVIAHQSINGKPMDFTPLRKALRKRLFGWSGGHEFEPYWLGSGRLMSVSAGRATWLDQFVTEYTEDQIHYGP